MAPGKNRNNVLLGTCVPIFALLEEVEPKIPKVPDYSDFCYYQPSLQPSGYVTTQQDVATTCCSPVSRARSHPVPEVVAYFRHGYATVQE